MTEISSLIAHDFTGVMQVSTVSASISLFIGGQYLSIHSCVCVSRFSSLWFNGLLSTSGKFNCSNRYQRPRLRHIVWMLSLIWTAQRVHSLGLFFVIVFPSAVIRNSDNVSSKGTNCSLSRKSCSKKSQSSRYWILSLKTGRA